MELAGRANIFISFSWQFRPDAVVRLAEHLEQTNSYNIWFERNEPKLGKFTNRTQQAMTEAIDFADLVLFCLSEHYMASEQCKKQSAYVLNRDKPSLFLRMQPNVKTGISCLDYTCQEDDLFEKQSSMIAERISQLLRENVHQILAKRELRLMTNLGNPTKFQQRLPDQVDNLVTKMTMLCQNPATGALLISGPRGAGKTAFILNTLQTEGNSLVNDCHVRTVFWLNCNCWQMAGSIDEEAKEAIRTSLLRMARSKYRSITKIDDLACYQPLFIFDDVFHVPLLEFLVQEVGKTNNFPCCLITSDEFESFLQMSPGNYISDVAVVGPLGEREIESIFKNALGAESLKKLLSNNVSDKNRMTKLVQSFAGLPKRAVESAAILKLNYHDSKELTAKMNELITLPPLKANNQSNILMKSCRPALSDLRYSKQGPATAFAKRRLMGKGMTLDPGSLKIEDEFVRQHSSVFQIAEVPEFVFRFYYERKAEEDRVLKEGFRFAAEQPQSGILLIVGPAGSGKTTLVSKLLCHKTNQDYLRRHCKVQLVIWLNCYQWDKEMEPSDTEAFTRQLLTIGSRLVPEDDKEKLTTLSNMVHYFKEVRKQRMLFVFDDVISASVLDVFRKQCGNSAICCVLTRYGDRFGQIKVAAKHFVTPLRENEVVEMLETSFDLKDKLNSVQLKQLAKKCSGSPLIASQFGGIFAMGRNHASKYENLMKNYPKIGKEKDGHEKDAKDLFRHSFSLLDDETKSRYFVMVLFDPTEPVRGSDLAKLWGLSRSETVDILDELEDRALAKRLQCETDEFGCAILSHQLLHEEAVLIAFKSKEESLFELRLRIMSEIGDKLIGADSSGKRSLATKLAGFMFKMVEAEMPHMLEKVVKHFHVGEFSEIAKQRVSQYDGEDIKLEGQSSTKTALQIAIEHGHLNLVDILCRFLPKAMLPNPQTGVTPMMFAAEAGHLPIVEYFLEKQPETINQPDASGHTVMSYAVHNHHWHVIEFVAERLPSKSHTTRESIFEAIREAVVQCHLPTLTFLSEKCSNRFEIQEREAASLIRAAAVRGFLPIVDFFHEPWRDVNFTSPKNDLGQTVLMEAVMSSQLPVVRYLHFRFPECIQMVDNRDQTVMMTAGMVKFYHNDPDENFDKLTLPLMQFLVEQWPEGVDKRDQYGKTALFYAAKRGYVETFSFLLTRTNDGADGLKEQGWELVSSIIDNFNLEMLKAVHKAWPDLVRLRDDYGDNMTPLIYAASLDNESAGENELFPIIKYLSDVMTQDEVDEQDSGGKTALIYAGQRGYLESFKTLLSKSKNVEELLEKHANDLVMSIIENGSVNILGSVIEAWPEVSGLMFENGMSLLMLAISNCPVENEDDDQGTLLPMVKLIAEKCPEIATKRDEQERTALDLAEERDLQFTFDYLKSFTKP